MTTVPIAVDLTTMLWVMGTVSFSLAVAVLYVDHRSSVHDGITLWGWGLVVQTLSFPAFALRQYGWVVTSIVLSNLCSSGTIALHTSAVRAYQRGVVEPMPLWVIWLPVALAPLLGFLIADQHALRFALLSGILLGQGLLLAWHAWQPALEGPRERGRWLVVAGSLILAASMGIRIVAGLRATDWSAEAAVSPSVQGMTYFVALVVLLLNTVGFLLMHSERASTELVESQNHDPLTNLPNRRLLLDRLQQAIVQAKRNGHHGALLFIDLDHFKFVNDRHGHQVGDVLLLGVAERLQGAVRESDTVARFGGDEFVVLLPGLDSDAVRARSLAEERATRLLEALAYAHHLPVVDAQGAPRIVVHCSPGSVGIALFHGASEATEAMRLADRAMYQAKQGGRNQFVVAGA
jgi:diguanylate cyclase (GGDEF)-like protein